MYIHIHIHIHVILRAYVHLDEEGVGVRVDAHNRGTAEARPREHGMAWLL